MKLVVLRSLLTSVVTAELAETQSDREVARKALLQKQSHEVSSMTVNREIDSVRHQLQSCQRSKVSEGDKAGEE